MRRLSLAARALLLAALLLTGCQWSAWRPGSSQSPVSNAVEVGQLAPDIEGEDLGGQALHLADYRGCVVVLTFWSQT
jgi:hypothetical protein